MSNQITEVRLLSVPLENDYKHSLYFSSIEEQSLYFFGKTVFSEQNFSYQRKDHIIRYPKSYDELSGCNYVMYRNSSSAKWVYGFITDKTYINDERTDLTIETDVIQTYFFDYTIKPSFIEREHTNDDTVGKHTFPENLEIGEYISTYSSKVSDLSKLRIILGVTDSIALDPTTNEYAVYNGGKYNSIYSGINYIAFKETEIKSLITHIETYAKLGKSEAINCMFLAPEFLSPMKNERDNTPYGEVIESESTSYLFHNLTKSILDDETYVPKNNKLKCYPYKYLLVSNNNGASAIYQYENFSHHNIEFVIEGALTPGCSIRLIPQDYKGESYNHEEGLNLGKYPICNWSSDVYTNWLTQNSVNIGLNIASGIGQIIGGAALGLGTGGIGFAVGGSQIVGGVSAITSQLTQIHQMSFTPPQSHGNTNCGDVITAMDNNTFTFYGMSIKPEYAEIIDNYFSMFGYKCNRVKTPLKNHRENYWYTKTIDVSIDGNITSKDIQIIKNCYNNGITFWKNPSNIGDYSVSNNIV